MESLTEEFEELTDTVVREALHQTLNYFFVWGENTDKLPINYGMFSLKGDEAIAKVINKFLSVSIPNVTSAGIPVGQSRLDLLQDESLTNPGGSYYDLFIGYREPLPPENLPNYYFIPGDYEL